MERPLILDRVVAGQDEQQGVGRGRTVGGERDGRGRVAGDRLQDHQRVFHARPGELVGDQRPMALRAHDDRGAEAAAVVHARDRLLKKG